VMRSSVAIAPDMMVSRHARRLNQWL
jgi:hypothetical protein